MVTADSRFGHLSALGISEDDELSQFKGVKRQDPRKVGHDDGTSDDIGTMFVLAWAYR